MMDISLIVPCYNEAENVKAFYMRCREVFEKGEKRFEVIFVNDGSEDKTEKELKELHKEFSNVIVVNFSRNFGKESAIYAGLHYTTGELISMIDADLQQDPEVVLRMMNILDKKSDIDIIAAFPEERKEIKILSWMKTTFYKFMNKLSEIEIKENASDFRTFRKKVKEALLQMSEYFRFSKGLFAWIGFPTEYISYKVNERFSGKTKWSFWKLIKYAVEGIVSFSVVPLHIATITGLFVSVCSLLYGGWTVIEKMVYGIAIPGYATLVVLILFLGGMQLLVLGIIGEYLAKTYIQGKNRPIYIVKSVWKQGKLEENDVKKN